MGKEKHVFIIFRAEESRRFELVLLAHFVQICDLYDRLWEVIDERCIFLQSAIYSWFVRYSKH
jgi:hypothetical protein